MLKYYGGKLADCLMQLYPDIGLQPSKFGLCMTSSHLRHLLLYSCSLFRSLPLAIPLLIIIVAPRKAILMHFAKSRGFDPLVADNWYKVSSEDISSFPVRSFLFLSLPLSLSLFLSPSLSLFLFPSLLLL